MATRDITETQILDALHKLESDRWAEVMDFIAFMTHRTTLGNRPGAHATVNRL